MKLKHLTTLVAMLAMFGLLSFAAGCEEEAADTETPAAEGAPEEAAEEMAEEAAEEPAEEAEEAAEEGGGTGTVCERAASCCEAYVEALSANTPGLSAETTCASVRSLSANPAAAGAGCQAMIDGWRQGLEATSTDVPGACAAE